MFCSNCGKEFDGRANATYCSDKCKQEAYRRRNMTKGNNLSDSIVPVSVNRGMDIQNKFTNKFAGSIGNGLSDNIGNKILSLADPYNNPYDTMLMLGFAAGGFYIGWKLSDKDKNFANGLLGAGIGLAAAILFNAIKEQFSNYDRQHEEQQKELQVNSQGLSNGTTVYSSNDLKYMQVNSLRFDGVWGNFLGEYINYGFVALVYGIPGGGKSFFATAFASHIEKMGKVLYILAEEGITNSVQKRIAQYNLTNTDFVTTRNESDVISNIQNYRWLIIDSINGMSNYNNHIDFIRRLKSYSNLYGIIVLNQVNKDGAFTGKNEVLHEVDIEINIENGIAETRKNRFSMSGAKLNIFSKSKEITRMNTEYKYNSNYIGN